jgi:hypothetical protein
LTLGTVRQDSLDRVVSTNLKARSDLFLCALIGLGLVGLNGDGRIHSLPLAGHPASGQESKAASQ